jgi:hypothetical protein
MSGTKRLLVKISILGILILLVTFFTSAPAYADDPVPAPANGNCITCHENLYFLHDTGNWFCLKESPMTCVDCHGGDPAALTKELAHANRAAHPVVNEDVTKCQQCHPEKCTERLQIFDEKAGISNVLVAFPYTPAYSTAGIVPAPIENQQETSPWINAMEFIPIAIVAGIALAVYFIHRGRREKRGGA